MLGQIVQNLGCKCSNCYGINSWDVLDGVIDVGEVTKTPVGIEF